MKTPFMPHFTMRRVALSSVLAALALATMSPRATADTNAGGEITNVTYFCRAEIPGTAPVEFTSPVSETVYAPDCVAPGEIFSFIGVKSVSQAPTSFGSLQIENFHDLVAYGHIEGNGAVIGTTLFGGNNVGDGSTFEHDGNQVIERVPGPIQAGATYQVPSTNMVVKAGRSGEVRKLLNGTSYDDPSFTITARAVANGTAFDFPISCYPDQSLLKTVHIEGH